MQRVNNKLIAAYGMTLTNGEAYGKTVHLAVGAYASDWWEVTDEEAAAAMEELTDKAALAELMEVLE